MSLVFQSPLRHGSFFRFLGKRSDTNLAFSHSHLVSHIPGLMATCAIDKTVALWDTHNMSPVSDGNAALRPHPCGVKEMAVGKLYSVSFYPSSPWLLGCGGSSGDLALWDMSEEKTIQSRFGDRVSQTNVKNETENRTSNIDFESITDPKNDATAEKAREKMEKHKKTSSSGKSKKKKVHRR